MSRTKKELAFLYDQYIEAEWTKRFTELADKQMDVKNASNILYLNAGTGGHSFEIREKTNKKTRIVAFCSDQHSLAIAKDKATAIKADIDFVDTLPKNELFDLVIVDASFGAIEGLKQTFADYAGFVASGGKLALFLPLLGSFGEIFSIFWEIMFDQKLGEDGKVAEHLIKEMSDLSEVEEFARAADLVNVEVYTARETFDYKDGSEFLDSPLVSEFLMPRWLKDLNNDESQKLLDALPNAINESSGTLSFQFAVKAAVVIGERE